MNLLSTLHHLLRSAVLTRTEQIELAMSAAQRADLAAARCIERQEISRQWGIAALRPHERQLIEAINAPARWMPDEAITSSEAEKWAGVLGSPLGLKIDIAMHNWTAQQAIAATGNPGPDLQHACGFARGCIASWQMVKTLSRLANAPVGQPEPDADTTRAGLDQYQS